MKLVQHSGTPTRVTHRRVFRITDRGDLVAHDAAPSVL